MPALKPKDAKPQTETELVHEILRAINASGKARVWRNNVGVLRDRNGRSVQFGLAVGSSDLIGYLRTARFLALEVKVPGRVGTLTEDQGRFLDVVNTAGGVARVVTSVAEAMAVVEGNR